MASNDMNDISRPTSRVLAPPGGGSSNIFGTAPEPVRKGVFSLTALFAGP